MPPGTQLGDDLTVLGLLGEGGTGLVYRAYHTVLRREVAVKMCHAMGPASRELSERLVQEARMCASVRDRRVPRVYALSKLEDGKPYLVMEKVEGEPLSELMRRGRIRVRVACELACELLSALEAVHRALVIHRDVKPSNLIINLNNDLELELPKLRLLDFGIGKAMSSMQRRSPALTRPGEVVGTPMYMAPEQMIEGAIDQRVDVYGAGIVLYEMLAGRPPFRAPSVAETFVAVLHDEMPRLDAVRPGVPASLAALVSKATSRRPDGRFDTAMDMRLALEALLCELPEATSADAPLYEPSDEQSPTLIWQRPTQLAQSTTHRHFARPLPASWVRNLRARADTAAASCGLGASKPVGFRARRPLVAPADGGWRVVSAVH